MTATHECTHTSHAMQDARSSYHKTYPRFSRQIAIRARCIACGLLVPESNETNPQIDSFLRYLDNWYTHNAKHDGDAKVSQTPGNNVRTCRRCHDTRQRRMGRSNGILDGIIERWVARVKGQCGALRHFQGIHCKSKHQLLTLATVSTTYILWTVISLQLYTPRLYIQKCPKF